MCESEVSIIVLCQLCSPHCTAVRIKNCLKGTSVIKIVWKIRMVPHTPVIVWNVSIHYPSLSAMFNLLHSSTNQELFEKHHGWFPLHKESNHMQPPNQQFWLSAQMNGTQKRTLLSPRRMHCTYCSMPKGNSWAEATLNSEKIKRVASSYTTLKASGMH